MTDVESAFDIFDHIILLNKNGGFGHARIGDASLLCKVQCDT